MKIVLVFLERNSAMEILFHDQRVQLSGTPLAVGEKLPDFTLLDQQEKTVKMNDLLHHKLTLISVVPDLNTPICNLSTRKFNQKAVNYPQANFVTVSTNPPKIQKNWYDLAGVKEVRLLSDKDLTFGKSLHLYLPTKGLDTRAIYIIDKNGKVIYREIVPEVAQEPNYDQALRVISQYQD